MNEKLALAGRLAASVALIGAITFVGFRLVPVNATTEGFFYLIAILLLATAWGLREAVAASLVAVLTFNFYFLPPIGTLTIEDPQNWVALTAFLVTAITASRLSAVARGKAREALERRREMERLYSFSRSVLLIEPAQPVAQQVARCIAQAFDATSVALYTRADGSVHTAGPSEFPVSTERLRECAIEGFQEAVEGRWISAIRLGGEPIGSLGIQCKGLTESALQSLTSIAAIGLERARTQDAANRAEVARQSDELKSMLMDAIAHEFQTPLTAIRGASSALLAQDGLDGAAREELLHVIDEETGRLSGLVSDAIQMARIEAGKIRLDRQAIPAAALIEAVLGDRKAALQDRDVRTSVPPDLPPLYADSELTALALRQLLDNAIKHSAPEVPIEISARPAGDRVVIQVRDHGFGIPEAEIDKVFERFYRGSRAKNSVAGSGLGLTIARAAIQAHGGEIWAENAHPQGAAFSFALPIARKP